MSDELATQVLQDIDRTETHFRALFDAVGSQLRAYQRMNQKNQVMRGQVRAFASTETNGTRQALDAFAATMADMEQANQQLYDRLTHALFEPLGSYATKAKEAKAVCNKREKAYDARNKKQVELNQLVAGQKAQNKQDKARSRLAELRQEAEKGNFEFYNTLIGFQRQKVLDVKIMCQELCHAEIAYHAEALEILTRAYSTFDNLEPNEESQYWADRIPAEHRDQAVQNAPQPVHVHAGGGGGGRSFDPSQFKTGMGFRPNTAGTAGTAATFASTTMSGADEFGTPAFERSNSVSSNMTALTSPTATTPKTPSKFASLNPFKRNKNKGVSRQSLPPGAFDQATPRSEMSRQSFNSSPAPGGGAMTARSQPGASPHPGRGNFLSPDDAGSVGGGGGGRRQRSRTSSIDSRMSNYSSFDDSYDDRAGERSSRSKRKSSRRSRDDSDDGRSKRKSSRRSRDDSYDDGDDRRSRRRSRDDTDRERGDRNRDRKLKRSKDRSRDRSRSKSRSPNRSSKKRAGKLRRDPPRSDDDSDGGGFSLALPSQRNLTSDIQSFDEDDFSDSMV